MNRIVAFVFVLVGSFILAEAARVRREEENTTYPTKYDDINLDEILASERLLQNYINCLLERGKCTPEGAELKLHIADALQTECVKCSEKQKAGAKKVIKFLYNNKPETWKEIEQKYDPEGLYAKKHSDELKKVANEE